METVNIHVNVDDGTPRFPLTFRVPLSYTVLRFKEIIESQEGLGISEQTILLDEVELKDRLTLGQQNVVDESFLDLRVNFDEIPSPTRKKGSVSSQHEDCVVPDIDDDEDDVFKFDRPNIPTDPRTWEIRDVMEWLRWSSRIYNIRNIDFDKFRMNGKGLCMLPRNGFLYRVPSGGEHLYEDFQMRLKEAPSCVSPHHPVFHAPQNVSYQMNQPEMKFPIHHRNFFSSGHLPVPLLAQPPHGIGPYSPEPRSPFEYTRDPNFLFFQF